MVVDFSILRTRFEGKNVIVAGNGPTLKLLEHVEAGDCVCSVNAGLPFFASRGIAVDLHWIQDRRVMIEKKNLVEPYLAMPKWIAFNSEILYFRRIVDSRLIPVRMLGYTGFSKEPGIGVFHGYTAVYGLLQLLFYFRVAKISLYGVGLSYLSTETRFYQSERGVDVDLHRAQEQVRLVAEALALFRSNGVEVEVVGPSMLKSASFG